MISLRLKIQTAFALTAAVIVPGCSSGSGPGTGIVNLSVSDAAVQGTWQVCVEFSEVEFKKAGSANQVVVFDSPQKVDLLAYQGMNFASLITDETLEAGEYQWVRLAVNADQGAGGGAGAGMNDTECVGTGSYVVTDSGAVHGLYIPSGAESGLKLNRGFTLPVGGEVDFVAEFDLMKSVHGPQGLDPDYIMRPVVSLFDRTETGSIAGEVLSLAAQDSCMPAVYLYRAGDTPDDNEDDDVADSIDPITSAMVSMQGDGRYTYEIGPVLAGMYDVAFSCDEDDALVDETLEYVLSADNPVEVVSNGQSTADFE